MATEVEVKKEGGDSLDNVICRLLDKAGRDSRCTLKLLRDKAEKRMNLSSGELKSKREEIKQIILNWWEKEEAKEKQALRNKLAILVRLAKAAGQAPGIFKGVKELPNDEERIKVLSQKLKDKGIAFSDIPTEEEIEAAKKAYELKKDMDGIDSSAIIEGGKRRKEDGNSSNKKRALDDGNDKPIHRSESGSKRHNLDLDEEADF